MDIIFQKRYVKRLLYITGRVVDINSFVQTQVGISAWALHYNPELIDSPREFRPQRWIGDDGNKPLSSALNFAVREKHDDPFCYA